MPPAVAAAAITGGSLIAGGVIQSRANTGASRTQTSAAERAAALEAEAAAKTLAFQRQQAKIAEQNFRESQAFNRKVYTDQQARLQPYRQFGTGAISQLSSPIPGMDR